MDDFQIINVPGMGPLRFPANMNDADIAAAIQKNMPSKAQPAATVPQAQPVSQEPSPVDPLARLKADPMGALSSAWKNKVDPIINNARRTFSTGGMIGDLLRAYGEAGAPVNAAMLRGMGTPYQEPAPVNAPPTMAPNTSYGNLGDTTAQAAGEMLGDPLNAIPLVQQARATTKPIAQALKTFVPEAAAQVQQAKNVALARVMSQPTPMAGGGAAVTDEAALRQARAKQLGLQLSKGEQTQDLATQQFESDIAMQKPETTGKPMLQFREKQKSDILNKFQQMAERTGAEFADPDQPAYRKIGSIVDKALLNEYDKKKLAVDNAYTAARNSGETKQEVPYQTLIDYIESQPPTTRRKLAPVLDSTYEQIKLNDPQNTGLMSIDNLETIYQDINKNTQQGTPNAPHARELKNLINQVTDGAGGDLYRQARSLRTNLATEFENTNRVAKLLGTKAGYTDRNVALSDVFDHIIMDGSKEEMQSVAKLLKKAGPEGEQAWKELQGQTVQYLRGQLTKNVGNQITFAKVKTAIDALEREDKLSYLFGKQGRQELMDMRNYLQDALVKQPGAINFSGSGNLVMRGLDKLAKIRFPGASTAADLAQGMAEKKKVKESINFNALEKPE